MTGPFLLVLVVLTSFAAYWMGPRGARGRSLLQAVVEMSEAVGLALLFFVANLLVGALGIFFLRVVTGGFLSLGLLDDAILGILSLFQGLIFQMGRKRSLSQPSSR